METNEQLKGANNMSSSKLQPGGGNNIHPVLSNDSFTIDANGDAYISQEKLAQIIGVNQPAISKVIARNASKARAGAAYSDLNGKLGIVLNGLNQIHSDSLELVTGWFAFESQRPSKQALAFYRKLARAGAKAYVYHLAGYQLDAKP